MTLIRRRSLEAETLSGRRRAAAVIADDVDDAYEAGESRDQAGREPRYAPVTFSEMDGVRYLHFGTEWVQGAMRLSRPDWPELEYTQQMLSWLLFLSPAAKGFHSAQLGLGTGALTKFCHRTLGKGKVTAVELNPAVVIAARTMFALPADDRRLRVLEMDAWDFVRDGANAASVDTLQVDLYDATARGPVLDSVAFYRACRRLLKAPGVMTINLFGDHSSFPRNIERICEAFDNRVLVFPEVHDGNVIALAFNGPTIDVDWAVLEKRAGVIARATGVPASGWVAGLRRANARQEVRLVI